MTILGRPYLRPGSGIGSPVDGGALLAGAGFTEVAARPIDVDLPLPGGGEMLWEWHLSHGTVAFIDGLPADRRAEFRARLIAAAQSGRTGRLRVRATLWTARR